MSRAARKPKTREELDKLNLRELNKDIKMYLPDDPVIEEFDKAVVPFFKNILTNKGHIATLQKLRDALLPKLMSSEVRVKV